MEQKKYRQVVEVTVDLISDFTARIFLWVSDTECTILTVDSEFIDDIYDWLDEKTVKEEYYYSEASSIVSDLDILDYRISSLQLKNDPFDVGYNVRHVQRRKDKRFIPSTRKNIIELWFYFGKSVPLLVDADRIVTDDSPIEDKMQDFEIYEIEEYLEHRKSHQNLHEDQKRNRRKIPKSKNLWKKFKNQKKRESLSIDDLLYLEAYLTKSKVERYEDAAKVRDEVALRISKNPK